MEDTANKKPRSRVQAPLLKKWQALDRAFSFLFVVDKRKERNGIPELEYFNPVERTLKT